MGIDIVIRFATADQALAQRIADALGDAGHPVLCVPDTDTLPGADKRWVIVLWTANSVASPALQRVAASLREPIEVLVGAAMPVPGSRGKRPILLADGAADLGELLRAVQGRLAADDPFAALGESLTVIKPRSPAPAGHSFGAGASVDDRTDSLDHLFGIGAGGAEPPADPLQRFQPSFAKPPAPPSAGAEPTEPAPVLLAASAPRQSAAGSSFTACLVAYIEAARESAIRRLEQFGEAGDRVVSDLAPDGNARWRVGAPVTVRVAGPHLTVTPAERHFEWTGRENAAAFAVGVDADAPAGSIELCFAVDLAGLPMAFIPMRLTIGAAPAAVAAAPVEVAAPRSVFVSYSSKDAASVTQRLSTLIRWSPGLDIFQDCLDLTPNEAFKPQLAAQIKARDAFLLFWSRNAAASPWVRWEYETARDGKGLTAILPMPLEDPAIAPPPAEFADAHWRDRFMLAGYALARIREEAGQCERP